MEEIVNPAQSILKDLVGELKTLARTETVVGAPMTAGEFTIIPVSRVSLGLGAGGGTGETERKVSTGEGGGGGGGIRINPVALVAIHGNELRVHMLGRGATLGQTVEKMPDVIQKGLEKLFETWQGRKGKPETEGS
jgi:uncharacterized spore protein YtfJ